MKKESAMKHEIKDFENLFYLKNSRLPDESAEDYKSLLNLKRFIVKLLKYPEFK